MTTTALIIICLSLWVGILLLYHLSDRILGKSKTHFRIAFFLNIIVVATTLLVYSRMDRPMQEEHPLSSEQLEIVTNGGDTSCGDNLDSLHSSDTLLP